MTASGPVLQYELPRDNIDPLLDASQLGEYRLDVRQRYKLLTPAVGVAGSRFCS